MIKTEASVRPTRKQKKVQKLPTESGWKGKKNIYIKPMEKNTKKNVGGKRKGVLLKNKKNAGH